MLPRERVFEALNFREPDRVPVYLWVFNQPGVIDEIVARFGSFEAFCDFLELDMTQAFPAKGPLKQRPKPNSDEAIHDATYGWVYKLEAALEAELNDPDDPTIYEPIRREIEHHKSEGDGRSSSKPSASLKRRTISSAWSRIWSLWRSNHNFVVNFTNGLPDGQRDTLKTALNSALMSYTSLTIGA